MLTLDTAKSDVGCPEVTSSGTQTITPSGQGVEMRQLLEPPAHDGSPASEQRHPDGLGSHGRAHRGPQARRAETASTRAQFTSSAVSTYSSGSCPDGLPGP